MHESITHSIVKLLASQLLSQGGKMAVAESCTGGALASACTRIAGSSQWFNGGTVVYTEKMKSKLLHISPELIATEGVVSEQVARAMALATQTLFDATLAISTTGIAGPTGATTRYPVGTVWTAIAYRDKIKTRCLYICAPREQFIEQVTREVLSIALALVRETDDNEQTQNKIESL